MTNDKAKFQVERIASDLATRSNQAAALITVAREFVLPDVTKYLDGGFPQGLKYELELVDVLLGIAEDLNRQNVADADRGAEVIAQAKKLAA